MYYVRAECGGYDGRSLDWIGLDRMKVWSLFPRTGVIAFFDSDTDAIDAWPERLKEQWTVWDGPTFMYAHSRGIIGGLEGNSTRSDIIPLTVNSRARRYYSV